MIVSVEKVAWRKGSESLFNGADAQKVANEIASIGEEATPKQIVDKARNEEAELHKCFEWDDSKAAELYRLRQARTVIGNLVIIRQESNEEEMPRENNYQMRAFYKEDDGYSGGYKQTAVILQKQEGYDALLEQARRELQRFKEKYHFLKELQPIFDLI